MSSHALRAQAQRFSRPLPEIRPGYTVRVHERIQEGSKERVQVFEGLVIAVHKGHVPTDFSFTVRKVVSGIGVEKVFSAHAPVIEKIEVKKVAKVRRAKLFFIRGRSGKSARMSERFTTEGEFDVETPAEDALVENVAEEAATQPEVTSEAPVNEPAQEEKPEVPSDGGTAEAASETPKEDTPKTDEQPAA